MAQVESTQNYADSYKYQWARAVARNHFESRFRVLQETLTALGPFKDIAELAVKYEKTNKTSATVGLEPEDKSQIKVGIIGAGVAGLFTAMILDFLTSRVKDFNVTYEILEASDRVGGRLYTHKFSKEPHDYYDVGAMRFPKNQITDRTYQLFKLINIESKLIDYGLRGKRCPRYYNDIQQIDQGEPDPNAKPDPDPFKVNAGLPPNDQIPEHLMATGPDLVIDNAVSPFVNKFKKAFEEMKGTKGKEDYEKAWKFLMAADQYSVRQFLRSKRIPELDEPGKPPFEGPGFSFNTVEWLEAFTLATGWYNESLAETVIDTLDFDDQGKGWKCLEGGAQQIADSMKVMLNKQPEFNRQVTAIEAMEDGQMKLTVKEVDPKNRKLKGEAKERSYFAVFNSTTLGALQRMDLRKAGLRYGTKQAIRALRYGASCKVGIKFKTGWWMKDPYNIDQGGVGKTDLPLRMCVYPSYNFANVKERDGNCVLLCCYNWGQDAQRLGSLILPDYPKKDPTDEHELKTTLLHNLALLHTTEGQKDGKTYEQMLAFLEDQYITHYAWDWYQDQYSSGAFAYFGPGQFSSMWPEIIEPNGWLFLIGEAASAHHAWVVGALESAVRGVYQMLEMLHVQNPDYAPYSEAMRHLTTPDKEDEGLPFGPLPAEIPKRRYARKDTEKKTWVDLPGDAAPEDAELTFTAAQVLLSFFEMFTEQLVDAPGKDIPLAPGAQEVIV